MPFRQGEILTNYDAEVKRTVARIFATGDRTFERVARLAKGAFPTDVVRAASSLRAPFPRQRVEAPQIPSYRADWPEPHLANYEWRFDEETAIRLADWLPKDGRVACLGSPTLFHHLLCRRADAALFERNPYLVGSLRTSWPAASFQQIDLRFPVPQQLRGCFDTVFADPPWYLEHTLAWLSRATELASPQGAWVFLCLFPRLARPTARRDFAKLISVMRQFGSPEVIPFRVCYETPRFEAESLSALGIPVIWNWRVGHVVALHIRGGSLRARPPREAKWKWFRFGPELIALRADISPGPLEVSPLKTDGMLLSTSARDPLRSRIDLWTSRNRIFCANGGKQLESLLRGAEESARRYPLSTDRDVGAWLARCGLNSLRMLWPEN